jgi:hypothetical protein
MCPFKSKLYPVCQIMCPWKNMEAELQNTLIFLDDRQTLLHRLYRKLIQSNMEI